MSGWIIVGMFALALLVVAPIIGLVVNWYQMGQKNPPDDQESG